MFNPIEEALALAIKAHAGQKDLDGKPVILHPLSVGMAGANDDERICGFLHDVVEDTDFSFDDLLKIGFSSTIVDTLRLLTHDKSLPYVDYIRNICESGNETALHVKLNDLHHNIERGKRGEHIKQVTKHTAALEFIENYMKDKL